MTGRLNPYPSYRDSGVEWLGRIPAHWRAKRLKFAAPACDAKLAEKPHGSTYVGLENIESKTGRLLLDAPVEIVDSTVVTFRRGDVLFGKLRPYLAKVARPDFDGVGTTELLVLRPLNGLDAQFLTYRLLAPDSIELINSFTYGVKMPRASGEQVGNLAIAWPTLGEQQAIAAFLDRETGKIDVLVKKKERLIELFQEKQTALIRHAVTKGLNPDALTKASGIPWLGRIPVHWHLKKLKYVASLRSGDAITAQDISESGAYPVFGGNGIRGYASRFNETGNYVLIGRQGALCGNINYATGKFWASEHAIVAHVLGQDRVFWLGELLRAMNLNQHSQSAAQPGLAVDSISNLKVPVPPLDEQDQIAGLFMGETARMEALVAKVRTAIERLQEYRTALISAAVTGQIDVRKEAA